MNEKKTGVPVVIAYLIHLIAAGVFVFAAAVKAMDMPGFAEQIAAYNILPSLAPLGAWGFVIAEFLLAGMLVSFTFPRIAQIGSAALLAMFIAVTAYAMQTGTLTNCGCFGNVLESTPEQTIGKNVVMLLGLAYAFFALKDAKPALRPWKIAVSGGFAASAIVLALLAPALPVDGFVTNLSDGKKIESWPADGLHTDLKTGTHLVFLFTLKSETISEDIAAMNTLAQESGSPSAVGMIIDGSEHLTAITFEYGAAFPVAALEPRFARTLYRTLPKSFLLKDGVVQRVWTRFPSLNEAKQALAGISTKRTAS